MTITRDSKFIVFGCLDGTIRIWNFTEKNQEAISPGSHQVSSLTITSDDIHIVSGDCGTIRIWSLQEKKLEAI